MEAENRITLNLDPAIQRRLRIAAALKGVSVRQYCRSAIGRELEKDEDNVMPGWSFDRKSFERLVKLREEIFGGRRLPGNSVDLIREAREIRDAEIDGWA